MHDFFTDLDVVVVVIYVYLHSLSGIWILLCGNKVVNLNLVLCYSLFLWPTIIVFFGRVRCFLSVFALLELVGVLVIHTVVKVLVVQLLVVAV